jgi:hypothetical protein
MFAFNWKLIIYYLKIKQNCKTNQSNCFCGNVTYIFFLITHSLVIKIRELPSFATLHLRTLVNDKLYIYMIKTKQTHKTNQSNYFCGNVTYIFFLITHSLVIKIRELPSFATPHLRTLVNEELFVYLIKTKQDETKQIHILTFDNVKFYDLKTLAVHTPAGDDMEDETNLLASESDGEFSDGGTMRKRPARFEANLSTHTEENKKSRSGGEAPVGENVMEEEEVETSNMEA